MKTNFLPALKLTLVCLIFFSGIYTIIILGAAQLAPNKGKGEIIIVNGKTFYTNIGQKFTDDKYFYSRPSAVDYNAAGSGGSNKANSDAEYLAMVKSRIDSFMVHNPEVNKADIPSEMVTASGSGLDPHISVQGANIQIKRIAKIRNIPEANIKELVMQNTEGSMLGLFGPEKINVLKLNLALDNLKK